MLHGDRYGEGGEAMQEIGGAIERIDDPNEFVVAAAAGLLAEHGMLRIAAAYGGDDVGLGLAVDVA